MNKFLRRLSALVHRRSLERQLEEDMAAHREMMPPDRRRNFGNPLRFQEEAADQWGWTWIDQLRQDLAYAARQFRRSPGFTLTAIAVLSLGIGVNLAEAYIFNAFLHRLDVRDVDSLVHFSRVTRQDGTRSAFSLPEIDFYRRNNTVLSAVLVESDVRDVHGQDSTDLRCPLVSGNYFTELGITPLYGRLLDEHDDRPGAPPVAVLGYDFWQNRFGGDPSIVLRTIRLNERPVQVVGIAPLRFGGLGVHADLWMTNAQYAYLTADPETGITGWADRRSSMFGRLKPGITLGAAQAQFRSLTDELHQQQPQYVAANAWLKLDPVNGSDLPTRPADLLLLGTFILLVLLVLFSACANLGNMLLARGLARQREIEIRLAVGAGRRRIIRQLMTENLLLAVLASVAALAVGKLAALLVWRIAAIPSHLRIITDWRVLAACAGLGLAATLGFGFAPALQIVKGGPRATRARKILVSVQVAASCVLLILSTFFIRAVQHSFHTIVAYDYSHMALVDPSFYLHPYAASESRRLAGEIAARLRQLPGVEAAAVVNFPPVLRARLARNPRAQFVVAEADPAYFDTVRLPLVEGRVFAPADPDPVVISESAARKLWPGQSPLGKSLVLAQQSRTVVGVVKDSGMNLIDDPESVEAYLPVSDQYVRFAVVVVRTAKRPSQLSAAIQSAASLPGVHPLVATFQGLIDQRFEGIRKMIRIIASLAAVATLLALIGIFGLLAFTVAQRTREIGVRMALGARAGDIVGIVLGQYLLPFGSGALAGMAVAAAAATVMRQLVYGMLPFDVLSFGSGLLLFAAVALIASIAPVHRALRIDPASALRYE